MAVADELPDRRPPRRRLNEAPVPVAHPETAADRDAVVAYLRSLADRPGVVEQVTAAEMHALAPHRSVSDWTVLLGLMSSRGGPPRHAQVLYRVDAVVPPAWALAPAGWARGQLIHTTTRGAA